MEQIYVIGHKNPDTDSIAATIAYADLKKRLENKSVLPARAGELNAQTAFILKKLGIPPPLFLNDIKTRLSEVMIRNMIFCREDQCLYDALTLFLKHRIGFLPVVNTKGEPTGLLTLERVTANLLKLLESSRIYTSLSLIQKVLRAEIIQKLEHRNELFKAEIVLTTGSAENLMRSIRHNSGMPRIIVTDDRYSLLSRLPQENIKLIVFANNCRPPQEILHLAAKRKILLLRTPVNSTQATVLLKQSIPLSVFYTRRFKAVPCHQYLSEAKITMEDAREKGLMVLDEKGKLCGIITRGELFKTPNKKVILVDHNEISQAIDGIEEANVIEILDHHRISPLNTVRPITFINYPVGSTSTIIALQYRNSSITPAPAVSRLLMAGILSDTVILKSPTTTPSDREMIKWLNAPLRMDYRKFAMEFFRAGSRINYRDVSKIIFSDFKTYETGKNRIGISQVETIGFEEFLAHRRKVLGVLQEMYAQGSWQLLGLMLTDISKETSLFLVLGKPEIIGRLPFMKTGQDLYELKGVISRKQQLMPTLLKLFE